LGIALTGKTAVAAPPAKTSCEAFSGCMHFDVMVPV
jgi:hypothetical protein